MHRLVVLGLTVLAAPTVASAQTAAGFGRRGQVVVTADRLFSPVSHTAQTVTTTLGATTTEIADSGTSFALFGGREPALASAHTSPRLSADFVVASRLTIGGSLVLALGVGGPHTQTRTPATEPATARQNDSPGGTLFGFAPRAGALLPLGNTLTLWPRAGFSFTTLTTRTEESSASGVLATTSDTSTLFALDLEAQLVWSPVTHLFVAVGPLVDVPLAGARSSTVEQADVSATRTDDLSVLHLGVTASLGGWLDL